MAADGNGPMLEPTPRAIGAAVVLQGGEAASGGRGVGLVGPKQADLVASGVRYGPGSEESELSAMELGEGIEGRGNSVDMPSSESIKAEAEDFEVSGAGSDDGSDSPRSEDGEPALWLPRLLQGDFFSACTEHADLKKNECNLFCLDCANARHSMAHVCCQHCTPDHARHSMVQIRKYVYRDVIRLADIQKLCDPSGIPTYVINGARVVFLQPRLDQPTVKPGAKTAANGQSVCEGCQRPVAGSNRFCSLSCKRFVGLPLKSKAEIDTSGWVSPVMARSTSSASKRKRSGRSPSPDGGIFRSRKSRSGSHAEATQLKRRKGHPYRSPAATGRPGQIVFNY